MIVRTLAIDTSGRACSVAVFAGVEVIAERHEELGRGHAERLIPWIAALPDGGKADRIVVGCGPGSFTGVRIGIAAARGLALGWRVPVFGVSSLALIAMPLDEPALTVVIEGGHGEVFVQDFAGDPLAAVSDVRSLPIDKAASASAHELVIGNAASRLVAARGWGRAVDASPRAAYVRFIDVFGPPAPIYGRGADARPLAA